MNATVLILVAVCAAGLGALIGWLFGSRNATAAKETVESLRFQLTGVTAERDAARHRLEELGTSLAAITAQQEERDKQYADRMAQLETRFGEMASQAVQQAHDAFLKRAGEKLDATGNENAAKIQNLLQPMKDTLQRYEQNLGEIEKARNASYGELKQAVTQLTQGNDQVRRETQRLANVMVSSPKARGRWGEEQLRTILESAGLAENVDFVLQARTTDQDGQQQQPDCVINLPGDRCIVIDVKCPLVAFEQAYDEPDEEKRSELLFQHATALKAYANDLGKKGYWQRFDRSPDFVIMFIPGEHFLAAAAERAPKLIEDAFRKGVIIASTINMLALAKLMAGMWRQEALAAQAKEIAALGKELHARIQTMGSHVVGLGRNLRLATDAYDDFIGSLDKKVLSQAKRFEELKVAEGNKRIADPQRIDFTPKMSSKLPANQADPPEPPQIAAE